MAERKRVIVNDRSLYDFAKEETSLVLNALMDAAERSPEALKGIKLEGINIVREIDRVNRKHKITINYVFRAEQHM